VTSSIDQLVQAATAAANSGRWHEAERLWIELHGIAAKHPKALYGLGAHALQRGDYGAAARWLIEACEVSPRDLLAWLTLAVACREGGDPAAERKAIDAALMVEPYYVPALLARGSWLERNESPSGAAAIYSNALRIAPPESQWPEGLRPQLVHARDYARGYSDRLSDHIAQQVGALQARLPATLAERWREASSIVARKSQAYESKSNQLHVPRLAAIPFFERSLFPWLEALEARTDLIRAELLAVLADHRQQFQPYIQYNPGEPVNQWAQLNHSELWSAFHLWRAGVPVDENLQRCPVTTAALAEARMADISGLCPNAMFSLLAPRTRIPPHHGETNARVIAHLPLIVPHGCRYRVGFEEREWKVGETLIFDDTIEHEARNDSDELRVVLIFDLWNPLLQPEEREMVRSLTTAAREFKG